MAGSGAEARRRRILEGGQDRLALITGRKPSLTAELEPISSNISPDAPKPNLPSVSQNEEAKSSHIMSSGGYPAMKSGQDDESVGPSKQEPVRKPEQGREISRGPAFEGSRRREPPSSAQKGMLIASDAVLRLAQQIPISNVTSQQVSAAVAVTEHDRMLCALTIAILVVLSCAGFPFVSSGIFRWIILFRPLFLVLITNVTFIIRRLLPHNQKKLVRGDKDNDAAPLLGDGYAWAEEAGRALELGLMLQNVSGALFMDCSIYATIVIFGLSLFG